MPPPDRQPPQVGALYRCRHCGKQHPIIRPYEHESTAARFFLFVECKGGRYFVGQVPASATERADNGR